MSYSNLTIVDGDLLQSNCDIIIHQANCFNVMGAGIAKQIKNKFPGAFQADQSYPIPIGDYDRLGTYSYYLDDNGLIVNLYSQYNYGRSGTHTDYVAMRKGLRNLCSSLNDIHQYKIGLPYIIGAGLAGGDPTTILELLNDVAAKYDCQFYLYKL